MNPARKEPYFQASVLSATAHLSESPDWIPATKEWIRPPRCPIIGEDAKQEPALIPGLSKVPVLLCAAALLAVPALYPLSAGGRAIPFRFSLAMSFSGSAPEPALPHLRFAWAGDFSEGLAPVEADGKFGFIDTQGAFRIPPAFDFAGGFACGRAPVLLSGKWGYMDVTGRMAVPAVYDWAGPFSEGLAPVATEEGYGYIDSNGAAAGPLRFTDARPYSGGYAAVRLGDGESGAWGFVDRQGGLAIPPLFNDVPAGFSEGLAVVKMENERPFRAGYIDSSGGFAIDTLYDAAGDFHEGRAPVGRGEWRGNRFEGIWGYVDTTGRLVTGLQYAEAGPFQGGKALVRLPAGGGNALIDRDGRILKAFRADAEVTAAGEGGMVTYKLHKLCGFLDPETGGGVPPAFAEAGEMKHGLARVRLPGAVRGPWAYIGGDGRFLGGMADVASH
jgi:hypothetical protein